MTEQIHSVEYQADVQAPNGAQARPGVAQPNRWDGRTLGYVPSGPMRLSPAIKLHTEAAAQIGRHAKSMRFYALGPDLEARGVRDRVVEGVQVVDYEGFVDLVAAHENVQSWL